MKKMKRGAGRRRENRRGLKAARVAGKLLLHIVLGAVLLAGLLFVEGLLHVALLSFTHWVGDGLFGEVSGLLQAVVLFGDVGLFLWWLSKSLQDAVKEMRDE